MINEYYVGGMVRDSLISKIHGSSPVKKGDIDIAVETDSYESMRNYVAQLGDIKVESPQFFTIRAIIDKVPIDYTLCRKETGYKDGRHPTDVQVGTIEEDLARRDLTINAIAKHCQTGEIKDPFSGVDDIKSKIIRSVGEVETRCEEDYLRVLRIFRFSITLGFKIEQSTETILYHPRYINNLFDTVSDERIREEFTKCFMFSTEKTLEALNEYPLIKRRMVRIFNLRPVLK